MTAALASTTGAPRPSVAGGTVSVWPQGEALDATAPAAPVISSPTDGALLALSNVTVSGSAEPGSTVTVTFSSGGSEVGTADASGAFVVGRTVLDGVHTVRATARDAAGNVSPESAPVTFTTDTRPPNRPQISLPVNGSSTNVTTVTIRGSAEAGSTVEVFEGSLIASALTGGNGAWATSATFAAGTHSIIARARDAAGNTSTASLATSFTVDLTAPPAPVIGSPAEGVVISASQAVVSGTAEAAATILIYMGSTVVATTTASFTGAWSQRLEVGSGLVTIRAQAKDNAGNASSLSAERTFTIDTTPPAVAFATRDGAIITQLDTQRLNGIAQDDHGVQTITLDFYDVAGRGVASSRAVCAQCPGTSVTWQASSTPLLGRYVVRAYATDVVGNRSAEKSITVTFVRLTP